jgi:hypothetical protein
LKTGAGPKRHARSHFRVRTSRTSAISVKASMKITYAKAPLLNPVRIIVILLMA